MCRGRTIVVSPIPPQAGRLPTSPSMSRNNFRVLGLAILAMTAGGALLGFVSRRAAEPSISPPSLSVAASGSREPALPKSFDLPDLVSMASDSVVTIQCLDDLGTVLGTGSGFLVDAGTVVTNWHVAATGQQLWATFTDGMRSPLRQIIAADEALDLAILSDDGPALHGRPSLPLADYLPRVGSEVVNIGNPLGFLEGSVSQGIVAALRTLERTQLVQITAAISPGSSGSPVLDRSGHVIGVASSAIDDGQQLNFAVPAVALRGLAHRAPKDVAQWAPNAVTAAEAAFASRTFAEVKQSLVDSFRTLVGPGVEGQLAGASYDLLRLHPDVPRATFAFRGENLLGRDPRELVIHTPYIRVEFLAASSLLDLRGRVQGALDRDPTNESLLRILPLLYPSEWALVDDWSTKRREEQYQAKIEAIGGLLAIGKADAFDRFSLGTLAWCNETHRPRYWHVPPTDPITGRWLALPECIRGNEVLEALEGLENADPRWLQFQPEIHLARGWAHCIQAFEDNEPELYRLSDDTGGPDAGTALKAALAENEIYQTLVKGNPGMLNDGLHSPFCANVKGREWVMNSQLLYIMERLEQWATAAQMHEVWGLRCLALRMAVSPRDDVAWGIMHFVDAGEAYLAADDRESSIRMLRKVEEAQRCYEPSPGDAYAEEGAKRQYKQAVEGLRQTLASKIAEHDDHR
jgi:S1-C subfamily serine protease